MLERLPHGPEFRFVDQLVECVAGERATGLWRARGDEWFFRGHFPGAPIVPGVLVGEALAQVSGLVAGDIFGSGGARLAQIDVKVLAAVTPPAVIELRSTLTKRLDALVLFDVSASVSGNEVARGRIVLAAV
jgi:3-hydroxyacyl-[acyl-carrier-protein] dehydratase